MIEVESYRIAVSLLNFQIAALAKGVFSTASIGKQNHQTITTIGRLQSILTPALGENNISWRLRGVTAAERVVITYLLSALMRNQSSRYPPARNNRIPVKPMEAHGVRDLRIADEDPMLQIGR